MRLFMGVFEMIIGMLMTLTTIKLVHEREANNIIVSIMIISGDCYFAGFTKGFFFYVWC